MSELTTEQKLQAIIESYHWDNTALAFVFRQKKLLPSPEAIIAMLLDPQGLKAAYGDRYVEKAAYISINGEMTDVTDINGDAQYGPYCYVAATCILCKWLSSNGDAGATIDTAFSLLPDPR